MEKLYFLFDLPNYIYIIGIVLINILAHSSIAFESVQFIKYPKWRVRLYLIQLIPPIGLIFGIAFMIYLLLKKLFGGSITQFKLELLKLKGAN